MIVQQLFSVFIFIISSLLCVFSTDSSSLDIGIFNSGFLDKLPHDSEF